MKHLGCRMGVFYNGIFWQEYGIREIGYPYELIYIYRYKGIEQLQKYDVLLIPKGVNQEFLYKISNDILTFMKHGGIVISFGEVNKNWFSEASWEPAIKGQQVRIIVRNHPIFMGLSDEDLNSFSKAVHGYFDRIPSGATSLATSQTSPDQILIFQDDYSYAGVILMMTLDPDYHAYEEKDAAKKFLANIIHWAQETSLKTRAKLAEMPNRPTGYETFTRDVRRVFDIRGIAIEIIAGIILAVVLYLVFGIK
ncbi:MAG: hypothetical protein FD146_1044 [Anaerolineaceae bacterium]|nr:MAG: hypothetical protein FD146_1044 [Anaerolineaceae bacterium]